MLLVITFLFIKIFCVLTKLILYNIGPAKGGYFQWKPDEETGEMKPVTRMKKKNIERNPNYWDRVFANDDN